MEPSRRPGRPALAAAVAIACALVGALLVVALGDGDHARAEAGTVPLRATMPGSHNPADMTVPAGMTERQLRAAETATLGPEHAREHAMVRAAIRRRDEMADEVGPSRPMFSTAADDAPVGDPDDVGTWETNKTALPIVAIHAALLPTGKVMVFSYPAGQNYSKAYLWNPSDGSLEEKDPPDLNGAPANIWCAGQTFTADGELLVFGGNLAFPTGPNDAWKGLDRVYTFNPFTETWHEQPKMEHGRWYPSGIRMSNGKVPIISGLDESGLRPTQINKDVELFTPPATIGGEGTTKKIGTVGADGNPPVGDLYPRMFAMPDGKVMIAGADPFAWAFTSITDSGFSWIDMPDLSRWRVWGSTVLVPGGAAGSTKLLALGGTDYSGTFASATSETFDESTPGTGWKPAPSNVYGRGHANTVLLPDGSMVEVGGGVGSNNAVPDPLHYALPETRHIELWDKQTGDWTLGPAQSESRAYHSTALLLPDGRVMSAGDESNGDGVNVDTAEVYEPPYLHRGPRPTIDSVSDQIQTGAGFGVTTPNTNIASAALVAPGAVTHGVDMNQRVIQLDVTRRTGCVSITAPAGNVAPPGYYMLFLLNDQGVPSVAKFVKLQTAAGPATCTTPLPPDDANAPSVAVDTPANGSTLTGSVKVKATASDDVGIAGVQFKYGNQNIGAEDTAAPYKVDWQTAGVPNGTYELTAVARDAAGNTTSDSVTVTTSNVDTVGPDVALTAPVWGDTISGTTTLKASASDFSGVDQVQFRVDGADVGAPDTTGPYAIDWLTSDVANGGHALTAVATDGVGHTTTSAPVGVTVHNDPPDDQNPPDEPGTPKPKPTPTPTPTPKPKPTPTPIDPSPVVSRLKLSHGRFRKGGTTTISFRLNEAAKMSLSIEARLPGRKVRGRCVKPGKHVRPNCTRYVRVHGGLTFKAKTGTNRLTFRGKLGKHSLATGSYRLTLLARDSTGDWSTPVSASFKLLEPASKRDERAAQAAVLAWF